MKTSLQRIGWLLAMLVLTLPALAANSPPAITAIPDQTIAVNTSTANLPFTIGDAETPASALVVTASHDNAALVTNIVLSGSSASRTVRVVPHFDAVGTAHITITVTDGGNGTNSATFLLTVVGPPTQCVFAYCPTNMTVDCQNANGAVVNFTARGTNICNPSDLAFGCDRVTGGAFPIGTTPVNCWASGSGQTNHCTFTVTVRSNCPPIDCLELHCSTNRVAYTCGSNCVPVNFYVWAENHCNSNDVSMVTSPDSGTCFPPGTHTVDVWASSSSQTQHCSFTVTVQTNCPAGQTRFGGLTYTVLGGAAQVVSNELILSDFGTQGTAGVSLTGLEGFQSGTITLGATDASALPEGASITMSAFGFVNGNTNTLISSLRATRVGGAVEYIADYSSIGAVGCTVLLYDGSNLVAHAHDVTGVVARVTGSTFGDRWTPAFTDLGPARPFSVVEFPSRPLVALSGGQPVFGTRLLLSPQAHLTAFPVDPFVTPTYMVGWLSWFTRYQFPYFVPPWRDPGDPAPNEVFIGSQTRFEMVAQGAGPLRILDAQPGMFGFRHKAFGGAQLSGAATSFRIDPPPSLSNQVFGVDIFAGGSDLWDSRAGSVEYEAHWLRATPQPEPPGDFLPIGASLQATLHGSVAGGGTQPIASVEALKTGSNTITIQGSFPALGGSGPMMEIWHGSKLTFTGYPVPGPSVGYWPGDFDGVLPPLCSGPGCPDPSISFHWSDPIPFTVAGGSNVLGDRIRFVARDPNPMPSLRLDFLGLRFGGGFPGLQLIAEHAEPGFFFSGLAHRPIGTTSLTAGSNELAVTKLGTNTDFGVSLALGNAPFADVSLRGLDSASPDFSQVRVESHGSLNGLPEQLLGAVIARKLGTNLEFTTDFSAAVPLSGPPQVTVFVYDGTNLVSVGPGTTSIVVRVQSILQDIWELRPLHQFRPGAYRTRFGFGDRRLFALSGGQAPVFGTRVEIQACWLCGTPSPQPSLRSAPTLSRVDVVARGLPTVYVSREKLALLAQAAEFYRLSHLLGVGREMRVHNLIGDPGDPGGVTFPLEPAAANNFSVYWRPVDPWNLMPTSAVLRASAHGVLNGGTNELLGTTTITKLALLREIFANYSPVMPPSRRVEVLRSNAVVFSTSLQGASGLVATVSDWPLGCGKTTIGTNGPVLCLWWRFWPEAQFLINNQFVNGDEIRILAENTPVALDHLTQFNLSAAGVSELQLTAATSDIAGPIQIKIQHFGNTHAISWLPENLRQILQGADTVNGPWMDMLGTTAPPLLLKDPAGPQGQKFFRVRQQP